jgi:hypothetical protein
VTDTSSCTFPVVLRGEDDDAAAGAVAQRIGEPAKRGFLQPGDLACDQLGVADGDGFVGRR